MPTLNLSLDYFDHRKTKRLIGLLGRGAEVLPIRLWCYCGRYHADDGSLADYSEQEIESIAGWWGATGKAIEALVRVGFLDIDANSSAIRIHGWAEHAGHFARYHEAAKVAARVRWDRFKARGQEPVMRTACEPHANRNAKGNAPAVQGRVIEEKRDNAPPSESLPLKRLRKARSGSPPVPPPPPTLEEVVAHWREKNLRGDPRKFWGHHEQRGWLHKDGTPILRWKGAAVTWDANEGRFAANGPTLLPPEDESRRAAERAEFNRQKAAEARAAGIPKGATA